MALERSSRPLARCMRCTRHDRSIQTLRAFSTAQPSSQELTETNPSSPPPPPSTPMERLTKASIVHNPRSERRLVREHNISPIGSRRRRAALATSNNIPFHQLPYQCFQEARQVLQEDRKEKVEEIRVQQGRIERLREKIEREYGAEGGNGGKAREEHRLRSMRKRLEDLKILADINDPVVKKKFEDGFGDMNKPIYRHLADKQWRSYKREVLLQRITQMNVIPDVLPSIDPTVNVSLSFGKQKIGHGDIVESTISENPPSLTIQPYEKGEKLVTIAVVNPDVPDVEKDGFGYRCHFLASNIVVSPTNTFVDLGKLDAETQVIQDWHPPYAQKGLPYQRLAIFVLEQGPHAAYLDAVPATKDKQNAGEDSVVPPQDELPQGTTNAPAASTSSTNTTISLEKIRHRARYTEREDFILRSFSSKYNLKPIGVDLFRTKWDEGTAGVMARAGVVGSDVEFKRKKIEPLPYQRLKGSRFR